MTSRAQANVPYDTAFFENQRDGSLRSARVVVPYIVSLAGCRSVIDFGCGVGTWLRVFKDCGVSEVLGVDGSHAAAQDLEIADDEIHEHDLRHPLDLGRRFDLAVSLEVAEHLPPECAASFVATIAAHAPVVLFSAAVPGQGGTEHLNEQWPTYWADLFARHGYLAVDCVRDCIWDHPDVEPWYAQNLLLFASHESLASYPGVARKIRSTRPDRLSVVHPRNYAGIMHDLAGARSAERLLAEPGLRWLLGQIPGAIRRALGRNGKRNGK